MMIKDLKEHTGDYVLLAVFLSLGVGLYAYFADNAVMEQVIAAGMGLTYILWGILHHSHADKVTSKIVLEYVLVAIFGFVVINSLLIWR